MTLMNIGAMDHAAGSGNSNEGETGLAFFDENVICRRPLEIVSLIRLPVVLHKR